MSKLDAALTTEPNARIASDLVANAIARVVPDEFNLPHERGIPMKVLLSPTC